MHSDVNDWGTRLSSLAAHEAPGSGWAGVLATRRQRERRGPRGRATVWAACALALAAGLGWRAQDAPPEPVLRADADRAALAEAAAAIRVQNERLERLLAELPEPRTMRGSTAYTLAELEDRLALVDDRLSRVALEPHAPERAEELWRERVDVMNTLVQVRYADAIGTY